MEVGSYLTWEGWPRHRVFQDPRINGYPPAFHALLRRDDLSRAEWDALLAGFGVDDRAGHLPRREPARRVLRSRSLGAGLPRRRRPGVRPAPARVRGAGRAGRAAACASSSIARRGVKALAARTRAPPDRRSADCEWQRRLGDFFAEDAATTSARAGRLPQAAHAARAASTMSPALTTRMALGDAALRLHDPATAAEAYAGIDLPRAHTNRGLALLALGRAREALDEARAVADRRPRRRRRAGGRAPRARAPAGPRGPEPLLLRRPAEVEF